MIACFRMVLFCAMVVVTLKDIAAQTTNCVANGVPSLAVEHLQALTNAGIDTFTFNNAGGFIIVAQNGNVVGRNVPPPFGEHISGIVREGQRIWAIAFTEDTQGWCVISDQAVRYQGNFPPGFVENLEQCRRDQVSILTVAFGPRGSWIIITERGSHRGGVPAQCLQDIDEFGKQGPPRCVAFTPSGGYLISAGQRYTAREIPEKCLVELERATANGFGIRDAHFGKNGSWALVTAR